MTTCVPIKELKNTSAFAQLVEQTIDPIIVTKNGCEKFAVMTVEMLDNLRMEAARAQLYRDIDEAEADFVAGRVTDAHTSQEKTREHYGL